MVNISAVARAGRPRAVDAGAAGSAGRRAGVGPTRGDDGSGTGIGSLPWSVVTEPTAGPHHVLVVDDEPHICRIIQYKLEQGPYEVSVCHDGLTALERLRRTGAVDLVLLDLMLPQVGGLEVLSELRRLEHRRDTPVLVLTAKGDDSDRVQALALGALDIVTKPFSPRKLKAMVDDVFSR